MKKEYIPNPIDTSQVELSDDIMELSERIAKNVHEVWAAGRIADGWSYGVVRSDSLKEHPTIIPYDELSEEEKDYDRRTSQETLKVMELLGYKIVKVE